MFTTRGVISFFLLALFFAGGFTISYVGWDQRLHQFGALHLTVLTEKDFLFPPDFKESLESQLPVKFDVEVAEDPDSFMEKASRVDLLWARKDWILKTELRLKDFKSDPALEGLLLRALSVDFFDPDENSSTLLPLLWTLPLIRVFPGPAVSEMASGRFHPEHFLEKQNGEIRWPFWGLADYFPILNSAAPQPPLTHTKKEWILYPLTAQTAELEKSGELWFPAQKIKPLLICLSFVENERVPVSLKEKLVQAWMNPGLLARLASTSSMGITLVEAEELLPPWQRASALRLVDVAHLARP